MSLQNEPSRPNERELIQLRSSLLAQIERDFAHVIREGGVSLHEAAVIDSYGTDDERAEARKLDTDTHWTHVRLEDLPTWIGSTLSFMDPIGFHYYAPAFMCFSIRCGLYNAPGYIDHDAIGSLIFHCTPTSTWEEHLEKKFSRFTSSQRRCVARYLVYELEVNADGCGIQQSYPIEALRKRWLRELPAGEQSKLRSKWNALST